jgi:hypothetical protein
VAVGLSVGFTKSVGVAEYDGVLVGKIVPVGTTEGVKLGSGVDVGKGTWVLVGLEGRVEVLTGRTTACVDVGKGCKVSPGRGVKVG